VESDDSGEDIQIMKKIKGNEGAIEVTEDMTEKPEMENESTIHQFL
jgi:hypothetical protein